MDGFSRAKDALTAAGVSSILAASIDTGDEAKEVADGLDYPLAEGVTKDQADALGAWWEDRRSIIQPSEFLLDGDGKVLSSSYSSGPLGRIAAEDVIKLVGRMEARKAQG